MDQKACLLVYQAQTKNVRSLETAALQVKRAINKALQRQDAAAVEAHTHLYALLFCTWAETNFSKIIHTPYGFSIDEIIQIKRDAAEHGITKGWECAVDLGLAHVPAKKGSFAPNARQALQRYIADWVLKPSVLRNKIAHGQWKIALNRNNDAVQEEITRELGQLNIVSIDGWFLCYRDLAHLVETLIESPEKGFQRDWHAIVCKMEKKMARKAAHTLEQHLEILMKRKVAR